MRRGHVRFPARAKAPLYLLAGAGITALSLRSVPDPFPSSGDLSLSAAERIRLEVEGIVRSSRALYAITYVIADYKFSLWGLERRPVDHHNKLLEVHLRSAQRLLKLCETNKGFYVKAGQFVSSLRQVPKEYSSTFSTLQDKAVPCPFEDIKEVIARNLGKNFTDLFYSFDEKPIAAASIAQVHHALLRDRQEVAVKVQYPGLQQQLTVDLRTMAVLSSFVSQIFPDYRLEWMVSEFKRTLSSELDFLQEAKNAERTARNFKTKKIIKVPHVFWDLTTKQVLTMQFFHGQKIDDVEFLKDSGIDPGKVAKTLVELFSEMIFIHGFVHGDPHPGNILVSPDGYQGFSLIILDHGIYRELDEEFRTDYCRLWKALVLMDSPTIHEIGGRFGLGQYAKYLPVIFTGRTLESKSNLGKQMPAEEKRELRRELLALKMGDISSFMESMPPDFLTVLRTDGQLRSIMGRLGAPARVRLLSYARFAACGLSSKHRNENAYLFDQIISGITTRASYLHLRFLLEILELLSRLESLGHSILVKVKWLLPRMAHFTNLSRRTLLADAQMI
ncbi:unnamed protein product [Spirodela intermedia]|uniref:ABC1 atypical kinase-like domain-containing protein n=1 Tax=Spirodela intermedia TaxID=51605 RepID=A0A7I8KWH6_SPIIN|nr:unnamed protein product [Spirodela intermedia]